MFRTLIAALALVLGLTSTLAAETVCRRDEQKGCFSFQIVGAAYDPKLMAQVSAMSPAKQAKTLGMKVFEGMVAGRYDISANQNYVLYLWMDDTYKGVPLPGDRIVQTCFTGLNSGQYKAYKPRGLSQAELGSTPVITGSQYGALGRPHTALAANCNGGVGAGWVIPKDVMKHVKFAMVCPQGSVAYPFRNPDATQQGIIHSTDEIRWYLRSSTHSDGVIMAAVWQ